MEPERLLTHSTITMKKVYIETYGCQMNVADTEVVLSVLNKAGYTPTTELEGANLAFMNTCAIRENAEEKVWNRLEHWKSLKKRNPDVVIGVLGCMAEHLRKDLLKNSGSIVDLVVGPDEYRKLPVLIESIVAPASSPLPSPLGTGEDVGATNTPQIAVKLSRTETYDDILPFRNEGISAFISVMRGCDKFCTFCVVPFTRGRERSRSLNSIVDECKELEQQGFREITLLGQNVNSYRDTTPQPPPIAEEGELDFSDLLDRVARAAPGTRIRYTTSHPQDFDQKLVDTMAMHDNICKYIHLPIQSGSDRILKLMNRTYSRAHYMSIIEMIRNAMPEAALSTDIIVGFCTETLEDHEMTKSIMREVEYEGAYTFNYSPRPNTRAWNTLPDDVPLEEKTRRLREIIAIQNESSARRNLAESGREHTILVEGRSKKDAMEWKGRTDTNKMVIFPRVDAEVGEYRRVRINRSNSATLFGELIDVNSESLHFQPDHLGLDRGEVLYDLSPLVISSIDQHEHSGIRQPAAMELPVLN
jgi:tRNA-2-methylthio-N6-dimethylallyladenosine synthase